MSFTELEDNIIQGTSNNTLKKIRAAGIHTVEDLSVQMPKVLAEKADIGDDTAEKAIRTALNMVTRGFITGKQLYDEMGGRIRLTTGSKTLDTLLGGGIESGTTTEVIGKEGCHDAKTNAFTPNGIVSWRDIKIGDYVYGEREGKIIKTKVKNIYEYDYNGYLHHIETLKIDLCITPNHEIYFKETKNKILEKIAARELQKKVKGYLCSPLTKAGIDQEYIDIQKHITLPKLNNPEKSHPKPPLQPLPLDKLLTLIGYYIADGSPLKSRNSVYPTIRHGRKIKKLEKLVKSLNLDYSIYENSKIVIFHNDLGRYLLRCGEGSHNKKIPTEIFAFSAEKLRYLYDGLMECDADERGNTYYTTSKILATQFSYLCLILGKYPSIDNRGKRNAVIRGRKIEAKHDCYSIHISHNYQGYYDKRTKNEKQRYNGSVWCFTTETGNFFTERNGKIALSGNSGKTQLMHCLAVLAQLPPEQGGLDGEVVWIDTESTFRPDRIREIAASRGLDPDNILDGIHIGDATTSQHQKLLVEDLVELCYKHNIRLIIVDSMMAQLRGEYLGRGMLAARQNLLNNILQNIEKIVRNNKKIVAVYTNQVMDDPAKMYGNPEKAAGGHIMGHAATTRIHIRRGRREVRVVSLKKSPYRPDGEAVIVIDGYGIRDTGVNRDESEDA